MRGLRRRRRLRIIIIRRRCHSLFLKEEYVHWKSYYKIIANVLEHHRKRVGKLLQKYNPKQTMDRSFDVVVSPPLRKPFCVGSKTTTSSNNYDYTASSRSFSKHEEYT